MPSFDDELRAALRRKADRVRAPADPVAGAHERVRRIHRRRAIVSGTAVVFVAVAVAGVPMARTLLRPAADTPALSQSVEGIPHGAPTAPSDPSARPSQPVPSRSPDNVLLWGTSGVTPPRWFRQATTRWLANDASSRDADPGKAHARTLWRGPLPGDRWARLTQVWNPTDPRRADAWSTVLLVAREGDHVDNPYDHATSFLHQRPGEPVQETADEMGRIAGYGFGFDGFVLVVGSPRAETAAITADGQHLIRRPLRDGAATIPLPEDGGKRVLFQLTGAQGHLLTPNDVVGARYAQQGGAVPGWRPDVPVP